MSIKIRVSTSASETVAATTTEVGDSYWSDAAAAFLAAGAGCLALGIVVTAAAASTAVSNALNFIKPVGPLSGKTDVAIIVWLVVWVVLHYALKRRAIALGRVATATLVLVGLGILGAFPTFFDLFKG